MALTSSEKNLKILREKKAGSVIEELLNTSVPLSYLEMVVGLLERRHYQDVVSERALVQLCGYVLCDKKLGVILKQKYKINRKENKVYDLSERKKFCSNKCYEASLALEKQISDVPLWMRSDYGECTSDNLVVLPLSEAKGIDGKEVMLDMAKIAKEVADLDICENPSYKVTQSSEIPPPTVVNNVGAGARNTSDFKEYVELPNFPNVRNKVISWKSVEMFVFLMGEDKVEQLYIEEFGSRGIVRSSHESNSNYSARVRRFLLNKGTDSSDVKDANNTEMGLCSEILIPTAILTRQREILMGKLSTYMTKLLGARYSHELQNLIEEFIKTLNLNNTNILFKPKEWYVVCVVIIELLCKFCDSVHREVRCEGERLLQLASESLDGADKASIHSLVVELTTLPPLQPVHVLK